MKRKQQTIYAQRLEEIAAAGANAQSQFLHGLKENSDRQRVLIPISTYAKLIAQNLGIKLLSRLESPV